MESKVLEIINTILENRGKSKLSELSTEQNLRNDIGFDSLDLAELTVRVEAEFDIDLFADGMIITVGQIFEKLQS